MKIKVAQLFVREPYGCKEENTYLVCGLIKTNTPLETEATHIFTADLITLYESKSVKEVSEGNGLDGIMKEGIWRVKI